MSRMCAPLSSPVADMSLKQIGCGYVLLSMLLRGSGYVAETLLSQICCGKKYVADVCSSPLSCGKLLIDRMRKRVHVGAGRMLVEEKGKENRGCV